jgi:hypothetical protein
MKIETIMSTLVFLAILLICCIDYSTKKDSEPPRVTFSNTTVILYGQTIANTWTACDTQDDVIDCSFYRNYIETYKTNVSCDSHIFFTNVSNHSEDIMVICIDDSNNIGVAKKSFDMVPGLRNMTYNSTENEN